MLLRETLLEEEKMEKSNLTSPFFRVTVVMVTLQLSAGQLTPFQKPFIDFRRSEHKALSAENVLRVLRECRKNISEERSPDHSASLISENSLDFILFCCFPVDLLKVVDKLSELL